MNSSSSSSSSRNHARLDARYSHSALSFFCFFPFQVLNFVAMTHTMMMILGKNEMNFQSIVLVEDMVSSEVKNCSLPRIEFPS
jgi:hypothetical protein